MAQIPYCALILSCLAALALGVCAMADIPGPGTKSASTIARLESLAEYPNYRFWVASTLRNRGNREDVRFTVLDPAKAEIDLISYRWAGPQYLLAVPKKLLQGANPEPMADWLDGKVPGLLMMELPAGYRDVPITDNREMFSYDFKVQIVQANPRQEPTMSLLELGRTAPNPYRGPPHWFVPGAVLLMIVGSLFWIRRNSRKSKMGR